MSLAGRDVAIAGYGRTARVDDTLAVVAAAMERRGAKPVRIHVDDERLPRRPGRSLKRRHSAFTATPPPLMASWRAARHIERLTQPGDIVVVTDHRGFGGVFSLEQAMRPASERRTVVATAADSIALEYLAIAGTIEGADGEDASAIDWELVLYRFASLVLATSERAIELLSGLGLPATPIGPESLGAPRLPEETPETIWLPEAVSRRARTPVMLRALSGLGALRDVVVSGRDEPDRVWSGTTWETTDGLRASLVPSVRRSSDIPPDCRLIVLGDPFAQPPPEVVTAVRGGIPVAVASGSAAALAFHDAPTWSNEDDLARLLTGFPQAHSAPTAPAPVTFPEPVEPAARAQRISIGIPVFRTIGFLKECLASVLGQTLQPHEVIIVDDGSGDPGVVEALEKAAAAAPDLMRVISQPNRGVCVARNRALDDMTGDAFVFVDADDELDPRFLEACAAALRSNPDLDAVATWTEFFGTYAGVEAKPPFDARVGLRENPIVSTCVLVDMRVRDRGVRFAPDLAFLYCEDWDFWAQMVSSGGRFGLVPEPLARHRVYEASGGFRRTDLAHALGRARATARLR